MKKYTVLFCLLAVMLVIPTASAAPGWALVQEMDIAADKAVTPIDYGFFDEAGSGRIEMSNFKNLYGAGAGMIVYVLTDQTDTGSDWLQMGFSGGILEVKFLKRQTVVLTERLSAINPANPLVLTIRDGKLTVSIGVKSRTVQNVSAFKGSLTTQSIECKLKAYQWQDE